MCRFKRLLQFSACLLLLTAIVPPRLVYSMPPPPPPTDHGDPDEIIERPRPPQVPPGGSRGVVNEDESIEWTDTGSRESGWLFISAFQALWIFLGE